MTLRYSTAVFDLDNTFYDWVAVFAATTTCFVDSLSRMSGIDPAMLETELREVFAAAGSMEHTFLMQGLPSLQGLHPHDSPMQLVERYRPTIEAVQIARRGALKLYPGVLEGLHLLRQHGVTVAALSSAPLFAASQRLRVLGLSEHFDLLVAAQDLPIPDHADLSKLRSHPDAAYDARIPLWDAGSLRKPAPTLLLSVLDRLGAQAASTVMIGDDVRNDIAMAQGAGVDAIWARYGTDHRSTDREVLLKFTHWSPEQASAHYKLTPAAAGYGDVLVADSFSDVVDIIVGSGPHG